MYTSLHSSLILISYLIVGTNSKSVELFNSSTISTPNLEVIVSWTPYHEDFSYYFGIPSEEKHIPEVYFVNPNIVVNRNNTEKIVKTVIFYEKGKFFCDKPSPSGLRIGISVVHEIDMIPESENQTDISIPYFLKLIQSPWKTMFSDCNASEVILVSCRPECDICESVNTSYELLNPRCHHLLTISATTIVSKTFSNL